MNQGRREMNLPVQPLDNQQEDQPILPPRKCPRCSSMNTKFCYYNNYSLSQPRYHCKTCRRYWTHGGTQREIPVGGSCRKSKRMKTSSSGIGSSRPQLPQPYGPALNYSDGGFTSMNYFPKPLPAFRVVSSSSNLSFLPGFNQQAQNLQQMDSHQMGNEGMMVETNRLLGYGNQSLVNNNNDDYRSNPYLPWVENSVNYFPDSYLPSFENSLNYLPDSYLPSFENPLNYLPDSYPPSFENSLNYFPDSYRPSFENSLNYLSDSYLPSFENPLNYLPDSYPPSFENSSNYLPDFPGYDPPPL